MTPNRFPINQDTPEGEAAWHAIRRLHIGGSEVGALFQAHPYLTAFQLYHRIKGNLPDNGGGNLMTEWGKHCEPFVARIVTESHGWLLRKCEDYLEHAEHTKLGCTLDYDVVESEFGPGILEIKVVTHDQRGDWKEDRAPDYVEWQIQHQLLVSGHKWGAIAAMFHGDPGSTRVMLRHANEKAHRAIIERVAKFMADLADGNEPPVEGSADYAPMVDIFLGAPEADATTAVRLDDVKGIDGKLDALKNLQATATQADKDIKAIKAELLQLALARGEGRAPLFLQSAEFEIKLKKTERKGFTVKPSTILGLDVKRIQKNVGGSYGE